MTVLGRPAAIVVLLALAACAPPPAAQPPDTRAEDAATIHAAVKAWSAAAQAKDPDAFVSVYADDATLMLEDAPDMQGLATLREGIAGMMQDPNFDLSFAADDVVVARSGDLAYEVGTYSLTLSDEEQNPSTETGHYVVIWAKQDDGTWKVVVDAPVSDPPAAAAAD